jgi:ubiquitin-activating enzyme E1
MDFITAASNLRATNYSIETADKHKSKQIAGKIIPAIATTTAFVAGLVGLELCKVVNGNKKIESFKSASTNLALPFFAFHEPIACPVQKYNDVEWTLWDRFDLKGPLTLQQFLDYFKERDLEVSMVSCGVKMVYNVFINPVKQKEKFFKNLEDIIKDLYKDTAEGEAPKSYVLEIMADDAEDEEADVPYVLYRV